MTTNPDFSKSDHRILVGSGSLMSDEKYIAFRLSWWTRIKLFFLLLWLRYFSRKRYKPVSPSFEYDGDGNITRFRSYSLAPDQPPLWDAETATKRLRQWASSLPPWGDVDVLRERANRLHRRAQRAEGRAVAEQHRQIRQLEDRLAKSLDAGRRRLKRILDDAHSVIQANHRLQVQIDDLRKNGTACSPASDSHCGDCPRVLPGPEQDFCNVYGDLLVYVGREKGSYLRLDACRKRGQVAATPQSTPEEIRLGVPARAVIRALYDAGGYWERVEGVDIFLRYDGILEVAAVRGGPRCSSVAARSAEPDKGHVAMGA